MQQKSIRPRICCWAVDPNHLPRPGLALQTALFTHQELITIMSDAVFLIRNQLGQFWTRTQEWVDGREPQRLLKFRHQDEALNQLVELSAKDIELRGDLVSVQTNARGEPVVDASAHSTPTLAEKAAIEAQRTAADEEEAEEGATEAANTDTEHAAEDAGTADTDPASEPPAAAAVS